MIPQSGVLTEDFEVEEEPSLTYRMRLQQDIILGKTEGIDAMEQVIYKILNTERYEYIMYSWDYGIETLDLYGEPVSYVCPEIKRRITEALTQDDRILSVDAFSFDTKTKGQIVTNFTVTTIYGDVETSLEVAI
jgi:hypothetical protein